MLQDALEKVISNGVISQKDFHFQIITGSVTHLYKIEYR
ncbi:hypothetical protein LEP1GSC188_1944 [Leptospira weilii serovar Topaz str. LT2116]|uniref:Uncharacterized protein n=1 Tax=Leptospira weilii serovar Topaz str. LT2116 TaxID=1088540 RepID=M3H3Q6_9LEPT|nr:hypothetical protein LEP1GSC188_1944 [Leptospira weilii serovar Topaz str. LT2116]